MGLRIVVAADPAGYDYKKAIRRDLEQDECVDEIIDAGVKGGERTSYPYVGVADARLITEGKADREIFCCGMGMGVAVSANKIPSTRASIVHDGFSVEWLILPGDAHVLCLGQCVIGLELTRGPAREFLDYESDPSSRSKASIDVLVKCENGSAGCQGCFRRLSKERGLEKLAQLPLSGIADYTQRMSHSPDLKGALIFIASLRVFLFGLLAVITGGAVSAAIGGNYAFVLTGFCVPVSWGIFTTTENSFGFGYISFGPFMGPYIASAEGAAAAVYTRYKGYMEDGKDVDSPLVGLGRPDVIYVGSTFGVFGYIVQTDISKIPWFGGHTDFVALMVLISGTLARIMFDGDPGKGLVKGSLHSPHTFVPGAKTFLEKIKPGPNGRWLGWQEHHGPLITIGSLFGISIGAVSIFLAASVPKGAAFASAFAFGISAVIILFLVTNRSVPVQHHVMNIAGLAAIQFFPTLMDDDFKWTATATWDSKTQTMATLALMIADIFGIFNAFVCELFARLWYNRGTSHIDPPAVLIWICNTIMVSLAALF